MKKTVLLTAIIALFLGACTKTEKEPVHPLAVTEVAQENHSLVVKFSGTRCGPCGTWGWTMMEDLVGGIGSDGLPMTAYGDNFVAQGFITGESTSLQNDWGAQGYPHFGANGSVTTIDRSAGVYTEQEKDEVFARVVAHKSAAVKVNTGLNYEIVDGKINLRYKTKAFEAQSDEVYLSIYIVENHVVGAQSGHSETPNTHHKYVLRKEVLAGGAYGKSLGTMSAGQEIEGEASLDVDAEWNSEHLYVYVVNHTKAGATYSFVNANKGNLVL